MNKIGLKVVFLFSLLLAQLINNLKHVRTSDLKRRVLKEIKDYKLLYISDNSKKNCSFCTFNLLIEKLGLLFKTNKIIYFQTIIHKKYNCVKTIALILLKHYSTNDMFVNLNCMEWLIKLLIPILNQLLTSTFILYN